MSRQEMISLFKIINYMNANAEPTGMVLRRLFNCGYPFYSFK